jgi:hypothetical protein
VKNTFDLKVTTQRIRRTGKHNPTKKIVYAFYFPFSQICPVGFLNHGSKSGKPLFDSARVSHSHDWKI